MRKIVAFIGCRLLEMPVSDVAVYLRVSQPAVSNMIPQGKVLVEKWKIDIL